METTSFGPVMALKLTRIDIDFVATKPVDWPHFAGSSLRGAWGRALRQAACSTGQPHCGGCALRAHCAYGAVFDPAPPAQALHPSFQDGIPQYIVQPPPLGACRLAPGQPQNFSLLLLAGAQAHQRLIEHVLRAAIEKELAGPAQFRLERLAVSHLSPDLNAEAACTAVAEQLQLTLRWRTPLRLQQGGKPIQRADLVDASLLLRAAQRRHLQWCQISGQTAPDIRPLLQAVSACRLRTDNLRWHDINRYSNRQQQKIPLGGLMGSAQLSGPTAVLRSMLPLLRLGEQLHLGKETVMGLGRFSLSELHAA